MNQCESAEDDTGEGLLLGGGIFGDNPVLGPNEEHLPSKPETSASRLAEVARAVREGHTKAVTVRQLLLWFGASRRGSRVVDAIRSSLDHAQLVTEPDFEGAFIDSNVRFELRSNAEARSNATESSGNVPPGEPTAASVSNEPTATHVDASLRVSRLGAASKSPISVNPDALLSVAISLMLLHNYSQLPVMQSEREVKGAISWCSIASRIGTGFNGQTVKEFMDPVVVIDSSTLMFDAITSILEHEFVLVKADDKRIVGLITAGDLNIQFRILAEPFLLIAEIENELRRIIQEKFTVEELAAAKDPSDPRTIGSVHDLSFGEYVRLLQNQSNWDKCLPTLDRKTVVKQLEIVRDVRNDVMHFDPDPIDADNIGLLRDVSRLLRRFREVRLT